MYNLSIEVLLGRVIGLVLGFTLHEWAHAWTAYRLGDLTAYRQGRLTLDPRAHIDPMGIILALLAGFGWARPVPVNPAAFYPDEKRGLMIVSLAGPLMNLLLAILFGIVVRLLTGMGALESQARILISSGDRIAIGVGTTGAVTFLYQVIGTIIMFNLVLFLFNLLPFSPLDGYKIAVGLLPREQSGALVRYERETTFALLLLLMAGFITAFNPLWSVLGPPVRWLYGAVSGFYPVF